MIIYYYLWLIFDFVDAVIYYIYIVYIGIHLSRCNTINNWNIIAENDNVDAFVTVNKIKKESSMMMSET